jgi:hypothetical protein
MLTDRQKEVSERQKAEAAIFPDIRSSPTPARRKEDSSNFTLPSELDHDSPATPVINPAQDAMDDDELPRSSPIAASVSRKQSRRSTPVAPIAMAKMDEETPDIPSSPPFPSQQRRVSEETPVPKPPLQSSETGTDDAIPNTITPSRLAQDTMNSQTRRRLVNQARTAFELAMSSPTNVRLAKLQAGSEILDTPNSPSSYTATALAEKQLISEVSASATRSEDTPPNRIDSPRKLPKSQKHVSPSPQPKQPAHSSSMMLLATADLAEVSGLSSNSEAELSQATHASKHARRTQSDSHQSEASTNNAALRPLDDGSQTEEPEVLAHSTAQVEHEPRSSPNRAAESAEKGKRKSSDDDKARTAKRRKRLPGQGLKIAAPREIDPAVESAQNDPSTLDLIIVRKATRPAARGRKANSASRRSTSYTPEPKYEESASAPSTQVSETPLHKGPRRGSVVGLKGTYRRQSSRLSQMSLPDSDELPSQDTSPTPNHSQDPDATLVEQSPSPAEQQNEQTRKTASKRKTPADSQSSERAPPKKRKSPRGGAVSVPITEAEDSQKAASPTEHEGPQVIIAKPASSVPAQEQDTTAMAPSTPGSEVVPSTAPEGGTTPSRTILTPRSILARLGSLLTDIKSMMSFGRQEFAEAHETVLEMGVGLRAARERGMREEMNG